MVDMVENTAVMGVVPMQKHPLMQQRRKCLSQVSSCSVSALLLPPLLSAAEAAPHWSYSVQHYPSCSETLGCLAVQCTQGGKAGKSRRKRKMLLLLFSVRFSGVFFGTSDLFQQDEANSRHVDCPLAVSSKTATSCTAPSPFWGHLSTGSMAVLPSHPAAEGPVPCLCRQDWGARARASQPCHLCLFAVDPYVAMESEKEMKCFVWLILVAVLQ